MTVGEYIKELRLSKNLTQEDLGRIAGVKKAAVQKWESGQTQNLKRTTIKVLADYFNVSAADFVRNDINNSLNLNSDEFIFSDHEKDVIIAYRSKSDEVRAMVDKMLDVAPAPEIQITAEPKEYARIAAYGGGTKNVPRPKKSGEELNKMVEEAEQNNILAEIRANKAKNKKS